MPTVDEIRETQRQSWNQFAPGWKKWDDYVMQRLQPIGEALLERARLQSGHQVLDVATGTGEPGLTAATRIGDGKVIGADLSEEMIRIAQENARSRGIGNYEARAIDATALPFDDVTFDAVICRHGVMFFPDPVAALREFVRVAKPVGVVALSTWGPPSKNPWATIITNQVNRMMSAPPPPPDAPGLFRFAEPGATAALLREAGLRDAQETEITGAMTYDSPQMYWDMMTEVAAPIAMALVKVDPITRAQVRDAVLAAVQLQVVNGRLSLPWSAWVASGVR